MALGAAFYQQAELHRLRGEFAEVDGAYRQASQSGVARKRWLIAHVESI